MVKKIVLISVMVISLISSGCVRTSTGGRAWRPAPVDTSTSLPTVVLGQKNILPAQVQTTAAATRTPSGPEFTPTPDKPRDTPTPRTEPLTYTVRPNDTLGEIAKHYSVSIEALLAANQIDNPDILTPGQELTIPASGSLPVGPSFKIIPDSELVYSPSNADFDPTAFIAQKNGYLNRYSEMVGEDPLTGAQIVVRVAQENSVNPRLLLALLEYRSGWVTQTQIPDKSRNFPMQYFDPARNGLYLQLSWAANNLDRGYYLWRAGSVPTWILADGKLIQSDSSINAGTAGVQGLFSLLYDEANWKNAISEKGLFATYESLFGFPFNYAFEPLVPADLKQPVLRLPFEDNVPWYYTGGPHGGWADGSAWAAIDFAPPGNETGCVRSDAWEVAVADGLILRAGNGEVVEDLDGDGKEQTGWTILYMHVATRDRVKAGTYVKAGEHIGHPSCEGGVSTGTHLHLARRYNGEWIPADGPLPFDLDGWITKGDGILYDGYLIKDDVTLEAMEGRKTENEITRKP